MLFYAISDRPLSATEAEKGVTYLCPECQGAVRLRGGQLRKLHFYHLSDNHSCRQNGKSPTHLRLQNLLKELLSAQLEHHFPSISRIADAYCPEKKMVFEVQCSPISLEEMESRNRDYASIGLDVVWLLLERRFSKYQFNFPHYFTNGYSFYDRLGRQKFPVDLSQRIVMPERAKLPHFLKNREISFSGDLVHRFYMGILPIEKRRLFSLRPLLNIALESLTS